MVAGLCRLDSSLYSSVHQDSGLLLCILCNRFLMFGEWVFSCVGPNGQPEVQSVNIVTLPTGLVIHL